MSRQGSGYHSNRKERRDSQSRQSGIGSWYGTGEYSSSNFSKSAGDYGGSSKRSRYHERYSQRYEASEEQVPFSHQESDFGLYTDFSNNLERDVKGYTERQRGRNHISNRRSSDYEKSYHVSRNSTQSESSMYRSQSSFKQLQTREKHHGYFYQDSNTNSYKNEANFQWRSMPSSPKAPGMSREDLAYHDARGGSLKTRDTKSVSEEDKSEDYRVNQYTRNKNAVIDKPESTYNYEKDKYLAENDLKVSNTVYKTLEPSQGQYEPGNLGKKGPGLESAQPREQLFQQYSKPPSDKHLTQNPYSQRLAEAAKGVRHYEYGQDSMESKGNIEGLRTQESVKHPYRTDQSIKQPYRQNEPMKQLHRVEESTRSPYKMEPNATQSYGTEEAARQPYRTDQVVRQLYRAEEGTKLSYRAEESMKYSNRPGERITQPYGTELSGTLPYRVNTTRQAYGTEHTGVLPYRTEDTLKQSYVQAESMKQHYGSEISINPSYRTEEGAKQPLKAEEVMKPPHQAEERAKTAYRADESVTKSYRVGDAAKTSHSRSSAVGVDYAVQKNLDSKEPFADGMAFQKCQSNMIRGIIGEETKAVSEIAESKNSPEKDRDDSTIDKANAHEKLKKDADDKGMASEDHKDLAQKTGVSPTNVSLDSSTDVEMIDVGVEKERKHDGAVDGASTAVSSDNSLMEEHEVKKEETVKESLTVEERPEKEEEIVSKMDKMDKEILECEQNIKDLQTSEVQLERDIEELQEEITKEHGAIQKPKEPERLKSEDPRDELMDYFVNKFRSRNGDLVSKVYKENKAKAKAFQVKLQKLNCDSSTSSKPLYNQPSDLPFYYENIRRHKNFRRKLINFLRVKKLTLIKSDETMKQQYMKQKEIWLKKVERIENNIKRRAKLAKVRAFYEREFPEIKRQREQQERMTRLGSRSSWGAFARSEAEFEEIVDNLTELEATEKHMHQLAVHPPNLLHKFERRVQYQDRNGLIKDVEAFEKKRKRERIWTDQERSIFKEKFAQYPKDFAKIAKYLDKKKVSDCVWYYYQNKKKENFKGTSKKTSKKTGRLHRQLVSTLTYAQPLPHIQNPQQPQQVKTRQKEREKYKDKLKEVEKPMEKDAEIIPQKVTEIPKEPEAITEAQQPFNTTCTADPVTIGKVVALSNEEPRQSVDELIAKYLAKKPLLAEMVDPSRWSEMEISKAVDGLKCYGRNWSAIAKMVSTKSEAQCKNFYFNYKRKFHLESILGIAKQSRRQGAKSKEDSSKPKSLRSGKSLRSSREDVNATAPVYSDEGMQQANQNTAGNTTGNDGSPMNNTAVDAASVNKEADISETSAIIKDSNTSEGLHVSREDTKEDASCITHQSNQPEPTTTDSSDAEVTKPPSSEDTQSDLLMDVDDKNTAEDDEKTIQNEPVITEGEKDVIDDAEKITIREEKSERPDHFPCLNENKQKTAVVNIAGLKDSSSYPSLPPPLTPVTVKQPVPQIHAKSSVSSASPVLQGISLQSEIGAFRKKVHGMSISRNTEQQSRTPPALQTSSSTTKSFPHSVPYSSPVHAQAFPITAHQQQQQQFIQQQQQLSVSSSIRLPYSSSIIRPSLEQSSTIQVFNTRSPPVMAAHTVETNMQKHISQGGRIRELARHDMHSPRFHLSGLEQAKFEAAIRAQSNSPSDTKRQLMNSGHVIGDNSANEHSDRLLRHKDPRMVPSPEFMREIEFAKQHNQPDRASYIKGSDVQKQYLQHALGSPMDNRAFLSQQYGLVAREQRPRTMSELFERSASIPNLAMTQPSVAPQMPSRVLSSDNVAGSHIRFGSPSIFEQEHHPGRTISKYDPHHPTTLHTGPTVSQVDPHRPTSLQTGPPISQFDPHHLAHLQKRAMMSSSPNFAQRNSQTFADKDQFPMQSRSTDIKRVRDTNKDSYSTFPLDHRPFTDRSVHPMMTLNKQEIPENARSMQQHLNIVDPRSFHTPPSIIDSPMHVTPLRPSSLTDVNSRTIPHSVTYKDQVIRHTYLGVSHGREPILSPGLKRKLTKEKSPVETKFHLEMVDENAMKPGVSAMKPTQYCGISTGIAPKTPQCSSITGIPQENQGYLRQHQLEKHLKLKQQPQHEKYTQPQHKQQQQSIANLDLLSQQSDLGQFKKFSQRMTAEFEQNLRNLSGKNATRIRKSLKTGRPSSVDSVIHKSNFMKNQNTLSLSLCDLTSASSSTPCSPNLQTYEESIAVKSKKSASVFRPWEKISVDQQTEEPRVEQAQKPVSPLITSSSSTSSPNKSSSSTFPYTQPLAISTEDEETTAPEEPLMSPTFPLKDSLQDSIDSDDNVSDSAEAGQTVSDQAERTDTQSGAGGESQEDVSDKNEVATDSSEVTASAGNWESSLCLDRQETEEAVDQLLRISVDGREELLQPPKSPTDSEATLSSDETKMEIMQEQINELGKQEDWSETYSSKEVSNRLMDKVISRTHDQGEDSNKEMSGRRGGTDMSQREDQRRRLQDDIGREDKHQGGYQSRKRRQTKGSNEVTTDVQNETCHQVDRCISSISGDPPEDGQGTLDNQRVGHDSSNTAEVVRDHREISLAMTPVSNAYCSTTETMKASENDTKFRMMKNPTLKTDGPIKELNLFPVNELAVSKKQSSKRCKTKRLSNSESSQGFDLKSKQNLTLVEIEKPIMDDDAVNSTSKPAPLKGRKSSKGSKKSSSKGKSKSSKENKRRTLTSESLEDVSLELDATDETIETTAAIDSIQPKSCGSLSTDEDQSIAPFDIWMPPDVYPCHDKEGNADPSIYLENVSAESYDVAGVQIDENDRVDSDRIPQICPPALSEDEAFHPDYETVPISPPGSPITPVGSPTGASDITSEPSVSYAHSVLSLGFQVNAINIGSPKSAVAFPYSTLSFNVGSRPTSRPGSAHGSHSGSACPSPNILANIAGSPINPISSLASLSRSEAAQEASFGSQSEHLRHLTEQLLRDDPIVTIEESDDQSGKISDENYSTLMTYEPLSDED